MAEAYDPEREATWPQGQRDLRNQAWFGLIDGDLFPLREYLLSDYPITRSMRREIAACIEGSDTLHKIECVKRRSGPGGVLSAITLQGEKIAICEFVERKIAEGCQKSAAVYDATVEFKVSRATVMKARRWGRDVKEGLAHGISFTLTGWGSKDSAE